MIVSSAVARFFVCLCFLFLLFLQNTLVSSFSWCALKWSIWLACLPPSLPFSPSCLTIGTTRVDLLPIVLFSMSFLFCVVCLAHVYPIVPHFRFLCAYAFRVCVFLPPPPTPDKHTPSSFCGCFFAVLCLEGYVSAYSSASLPTSLFPSYPNPPPSSRVAITAV